MVSKALVAASTRPLILSILAEVEESYGYEIIQHVRRLTGGMLDWQDGMLYPVLHRLADEGLIVSRWGKSEKGRRRKYYRLQQAGQDALAIEKEQWLKIHNALIQLWGPEPSLT